MNVLVTGGGGQLALTIKQLFSENKEQINFIFKSKSELDITNNLEIEELFNSLSLDYCVNCAAYTNVELAETHKEDAYAINAEAVKNLASVCKNYNVVLIHISTDYVFDGESHTPYKETDQTNPINTYGASKLEGERNITLTLNRYFIIRASWLYSVFGHNFLKTVVRKIENNEIMNVVNSQLGTPTSCEDLAEFIYFLMVSKNNSFGLYHFAPSGETSWYGFASLIASYYKSNLVYPVDSFITKAKRPNYSVLDNSKAKALGVHIKKWESGVNNMISKYNQSL